jgi:hypothetical protein
LLDTVKLNLQDYKITSRAQVQVQPAPYTAGTGTRTEDVMLWDDGERQHWGKYAFFNADNFNVNIKEMVSTDKRETLCMVQFSVPKVAIGSNFETVDERQTAKAFKQIEKQLADVGILTSIENARLSRIDAVKTFETEENFGCYMPVLSMMSGKRVRRRDEGTSMLWLNGMQEISMYDKREEMLAKKRDVAGIPSNTFRCEWRGLKPRKVSEVLGLKTVKELLGNYDKVRTTYRDVMREQLFNRTPSEISLMTVRSIQEELELFIERGDRFPFQNWLKAVACRRGISNFDAAKTAIRQCAPNRMTAYRWAKWLDEAQLEAKALEIVAPSKRTIASLYSELQDKVLSD